MPGLEYYQAHSNYLELLRRGVHAKVKQQRMLSFKASCAATSAKHLVSSGAVVTELKANAQVAFSQQGDEVLSTEENFRRRFLLRNRPELLDPLHAFWLAVMCGDSTGGRNGGTLSYPAYRHFYIAICRVTDEAFDPTDSNLEAAIQEDWKSDTRGDPNGLTREKFYDSLFEFVDFWTMRIDVFEYQEFLWDLYRTLTNNGCLKRAEEITFNPRYVAAADEGAPAPPPQPARDRKPTVNIAELLGSSHMMPEEEEAVPNVHPEGGVERNKLMIRQADARQRRFSTLVVQATLRQKLAQKAARRREEAASKINTTLGSCVDRKAKLKLALQLASKEIRIPQQKSLLSNTSKNATDGKAEHAVQCRGVSNSTSPPDPQPVAAHK
ncbi:MAG: hypothetical protein VXU42_04535, partial [Verrucomicrobiota bacterium]|nr:hypothetical protein [Verrucomicrobiota bacterium]